MMTLRTLLRQLAASDTINFLATNALPRRTVTRLIGRFSKIEHPLVARGSIALWRQFSDVDLSDARDTRFASMHACFTRALRPGARSFTGTADVLLSPSDGIVVGSGPIEGDSVVQAKDRRYSLAELTGGEAAAYVGGTYVTLRLTAGMYHRFHAPQDGVIDRVRYFPGDCWNVNPAALARVRRLYCRNERATIRLRLNDGAPILLVPVAAILVAGIRLHFLDTVKLLRDQKPPVHDCAVTMTKGDEMGWFEHGSTIIVLAPAPFRLAGGIGIGARLRAGEPLLIP